MTQTQKPPTCYLIVFPEVQDVLQLDKEISIKNLDLEKLGDKTYLGFYS